MTEAENRVVFLVGNQPDEEPFSPVVTLTLDITLDVCEQPTTTTTTTAPTTTAPPTTAAATPAAAAPAQQAAPTFTG